MKQTMKRLCAVFIGMILLLALAPTALALPGDIGVDGDYAWEEIADGKLKITGYTGSDAVITIPQTLNGGMPVTEIVGLYNNTTITQVTVQGGVTSIGAGCFNGCTNLTTISLPSTLTSIGQSAFGSSGLTGITIPDGVSIIENTTFDSCTALASVSLPSSLDTIKTSAFAGTGLTSISIPEGATMIGVNAFGGCTSLAGVSLPGSLTSIEANAFGGCTQLTSITLPSSLTSVSGGAFTGTDLADVTIACAKSAMNSGSLRGCPIKNITITGSWTTVPSSIFSSITTLETVALPDGVTTIENAAFSGCTSLKTINLPGSLTTINISAFASCTSLPTINLPGSLTTIGENAFLNCTLLSEITIPKSVSFINREAFFSSGLTKATILSSPTFGSDVFGGSTSLTDGIYGFEYSTAQMYAGGNGHPFHILQTIKFYMNPENTQTLEEYKVIGQTVDAPADPTAEHDVFAGWQTSSQDKWVDVVFPYTVTGDADIYSKWEPVAYTITYDAQGGSSTAHAVQELYGWSIDWVPQATRGGYQFDGWYPTPACDTTAIALPYTVTGDATFYAKWTKIPSRTEQKITATGTFLHPFGDPIEGMTLELHSTPQTTVTDAAGEFAFTNVTIEDHMLYLVDEHNNKQGYPIHLKLGDKFAWKEGKNWGEDDYGLHITVQENTASIDITIQAAGPGEGIIKNVEHFVNPKTGQYEETQRGYIWIIAAGLIAAAAGAELLIRSRKGAKG